MPRKNRSHRRRRQYSMSTYSPPEPVQLTPNQLARELVRRGLCSSAILMRGA